MATVRILKIEFENLNIVDRIFAFSSNSVQFRSVPCSVHRGGRTSNKKQAETDTNSDSGITARKCAKSISEESSDKNK
jgi:hypothetical protein